MALPAFLFANKTTEQRKKEEAEELLELSRYSEERSLSPAKQLRSSVLYHLSKKDKKVLYKNTKNIKKKLALMTSLSLEKWL